MDKKASLVGSPTIGSFPSEICIFVLDDNIICSSIVRKMLQTRNYEVLHYKTITDAFNDVWEREDRLNLILTSVYMPDTKGLELHNDVGQEFIIPIILMSTDDKVKILLGGVESGTTLYIVKNVSVKDIENLWIYLFARKKCRGEAIILEGSDQRTSLLKNVFSTPAVGELRKGHRVSYTKEPNETNAQKGVGEFTTQKKPRVVWTDNMHDKFLEVIEKVGLENACPSRILEHMNIPGLTRHNIASHLQKHRNHLKQVQEGKQSTRSKYRINITDDVKSTCFSSAHSSPDLSLYEVEPQSIERLAQILQECSDILSTPTFDATCSLNSEAAICGSVSSLGHGQSLPLSTQDFLQLPFLPHSHSLHLENKTYHSGTEYAQNSVDLCSDEMELIQFPGGDQRQSFYAKSPYVGFQIADNGKLVADHIELNMALPMGWNSCVGSSSHYMSSTYINPIPQQQPSLPQNLVQQPPESSGDINYDLLLNEVSSSMSLIFQDSEIESILDGADSSNNQQQCGEAAIHQDLDFNTHEMYDELHQSGT